MENFILDATTIDPDIDPATFLSTFYGLENSGLFELKRLLYSSEKVRVTEVFNWPIDIPSWKGIADTLENIQQHSATFYVIWGPETTDGILWDKSLVDKEKEKAKLAAKDKGKK